MTQKVTVWDLEVASWVASGSTAVSHTWEGGTHDTDGHSLGLGGGELGSQWQHSSEPYLGGRHT
jgi:hypothetical protein